MARGTYSIGDAAEASGLPVKTIRYYEEIRLIPRAMRINGEGRGGGHRIYSDADVGRLRFIHHARLLGLGLADVRELLALAETKGCPSRQPEYRKVLQRHVSEIDERVRHLLGLRAAIEGLMSPARQANTGDCSWGTCACMRPTGPAPSSAPPSRRHRMKGGNDV
ncbi:MerR family transcriptional regulator [Mesorhizobium sp.]|uniref:MerR family transcriptional regulator n=1 Tax=Mesorhizobium sp. TaxID=1871066 RepID=UPI000FE7D41C|nr:MerR family transcriptional regulator [Mesorhizobium sp.]RWI36107.1 MAG: MerR family transcriptional regulator [Mesorhizobium sp.]